MKNFLPAALLVAMALMPAGAFGSSITGIVEGQADGIAWNSAVGGTKSCSYGYSSEISAGSCTYISTGMINSGPWVGVSNSYTADVYSSVDLKTATVHAYAGQTFANFPIDTKVTDGLQASTLAEADAVASVSDTLTFTAPGPNVPMQIVFQIGVDGLIKSFDTTETGGYAELDYGSGFFTRSTVYDQATGSNVYTTPAATVNSGTYNYFFTLTAYSELACGEIDSTHLCSATESSDFSDTAQIVGITLEDMNGNQLNGYTVSSQSGIDYDALLAGDPNGAPEPATWAMAGGVIIVALGIRRLRGARTSLAARNS